MKMYLSIRHALHTIIRESINVVDKLRGLYHILTSFREKNKCCEDTICISTTFIIEPLFYEVDGIYILSVEGIGFEKHREVLNALGIKLVIKTDNDLRCPRGKKQYMAYGFQRCNKMIGKELLAIQSCTNNSEEKKRALYAEQQETLDHIRTEYRVFLSKVDLENDLDEVLHEQLCKYLDTDSPVKYLQKAKRFHMVELIRVITDDDCRVVYDHYNFACLQEILK